MQSADEKSDLCYSCEENKAAEPYTYVGGPTVLVCERCLRRLRIPAQLDDLMRESGELVDRGQFDAALACLDAFMDEHGQYDDDQRRAHWVARLRVDILLDAGRYADAERACEAWASLGFPRIYERWRHAYSTAETLDALGRSREGLAIMEDALSHQDARFASAMWYNLELLASLSEKIGQPVDPKWRGLAEETAAANGVKMPENASLGKAILELVETIRNLPPEHEAHEGEHRGGNGDGEP